MSAIRSTALSPCHTTFACCHGDNAISFTANQQKWDRAEAGDTFRRCNSSVRCSHCRGQTPHGRQMESRIDRTYASRHHPESVSSRIFRPRQFCLNSQVTKAVVGWRSSDGANITDGTFAYRPATRLGTVPFDLPKLQHNQHKNELRFIHQRRFQSCEHE